MSADGATVVGYGQSVLGDEAFRWTNGVFQNLGDLPGGEFGGLASAVTPDGDVVIGVGRAELGNEAFRWTEAGGMEGLGWLVSDPDVIHESQANALSADGTAVVGYSVVEVGNAIYRPRAFRWTREGGMRALSEDDGGNSIANGVSGDGRTVVGSAAYGAFVWNDYLGMRSLGSVLAAQGTDVSGWGFGNAFAISEDGLVVVGVGSHDGQVQAFRAELDPLPVPEPATFVALAMGGLALRRRRR